MNKFIEPYNPNWKIEFEKISRVLKTVLNDFEIDIQHIGSTAVPGLCAKPVLDIDIIIENKAQLGVIQPGLEKIGYKSRGEQEIKGRFAFRQTSDATPLTNPKQKWQPHHLYVCYSDSLALKNHLLFRDALKKNQQLVAEYAQLKISLTQSQPITREEYTKLKTDFIISVLATTEISEAELKEITNANL